ncbi:MAG: hypothetical protein V7785_18855 [Bermanella sp.]
MRLIKLNAGQLEAFFASAHFQNISDYAGTDSLAKENSPVIKKSLSEGAA